MHIQRRMVKKVANDSVAKGDRVVIVLLEGRKNAQANHIKKSHQGHSRSDCDPSTDFVAMTLHEFDEPDYDELAPILTTSCGTQHI